MEKQKSKHKKLSRFIFSLKNIVQKNILVIKNNSIENVTLKNWKMKKKSKCASFIEKFCKKKQLFKKN